ncbi:NAD(P)-dependent oxidoreductase [Ligilactobacillus salivarius]|uniref:NAD(P)-dependent oxidoreductase n=1 Tax=Ligilactobacillus salivarius TaxID=1624 RepID=UPI0013C2EADA|nr:NAD(P)-dependent oxidoreductase [Ligilactobacillus salivarius]
MGVSYTRSIGGNYSSNRQEDDYYATPPRAIDDLLSKVSLNKDVWECACGGGALSDKLIELGYNVVATDIKDRGAKKFDKIYDFLAEDTKQVNCDIVTNPPYKLATDFVTKALNTVTEGNKVCYFLKIQFLEGAKRYEKLYKHNELKHVLVYSRRITTAKNGEFDKYQSSTALCHAWFVWEKGYKGKPTIDWIY